MKPVSYVRPSLIILHVIEIMMPHVHLLVGLIAANIFGFGSENHSNSIYFILGSVIPDIDFIFNMIIKKNSHRELPSHFPLSYLIGAFLLGIYGLIPQFWFFIGALFHTFLDVIDWEILLFAPFSSRPFSLLHLDYEKMPRKRNFINFLQIYYQNRAIIGIEILIIFIWFISIFLLIFLKS